MLHLRPALAALAAFAALTGLALAQTTSPTSEPAAPPAKHGGALAACRADLQTLCGGVPAKGGQRVQCLAANAQKASPECQAAIAAVQERRHQQIAGAAGKTRPGRALAACQADLQSLCSASLDKPAKCLRQNAEKLSPACSDALKSAAVLRTKVASACQGDAASLCGDQTKRGQVMRCLMTNQAKLSPGCTAAVAELPHRVKGTAAQ